jgi:uncharacterized protein YjbI with pentapeptide repeats
MAEQAPEVEEPAAVFIDGEQAIARIKALGETARATWFVLLGYLAFVGLTLLGVSDLDFFSTASQTQLPLVGIAIPTMTFFLVAPILGAALHVYLHLYLLKLWDALAEAPPMVGECSLGDRVFPWLVVDWALRSRPDEATRPRPLDRLGNLVMAGLVWLAAPVVLGWFWWRSATAHDPWLTLVIAAAFGISLYASFRGWRQAQACLRHAGQTPPAPRRWRIHLWRWAVLPLAAAVLVVTSWLRTEGGLDHYADRVIAFSGPWVGLTFEATQDERGNRISADEVREAWVRERFPTLVSVSLLDDEGRIIWSPLAGIDLTDAEVATRPADWVGRDTAEGRFRVDWCRDRGLPPDACAPGPNATYQTAARDAWCDERTIDDCTAAFQALDDAFAREWAEQRREYLANIVRPTLSSRDLRHAAISGAYLAGVNLREARLEGVDLREARLEGVDLREARLEGADLREARLEGADLREARLEGVDLREARLEGAELYKARLDRVDLSGARLEGVNIFEARLEGANLRGAQLEGAELMMARLEGADLREARLENADLLGARLERANLSGARLEGANLRGAQLEGADLSGARLEGANLSGARLEGANLFGAQLDEADLREALLEGAHLVGARLTSAEWAGAHFAAVPAHSANFAGGRDLTQLQLSQVVGDADTILPRDAETGEPLHVCSCWTEPPATLEQLLNLYPQPVPLEEIIWPLHGPLQVLLWANPGLTRDGTRSRWLCAPDELPLAVGRSAETGELVVDRGQCQ